MMGNPYVIRQGYLLFLLLTLHHLPAWAQGVQRATLTGQITNATDGQPLPFASVYLNGTKRGTATNENGQFSLADVPFGANELVVSYTGFSAVRQAIRITEARPQPIAIALFPMANLLTGVVVTAKKDKTWLRQVEQFERDMIGTSSFARQCLIANPEVLQFEESSGMLSATAREPLIINNLALGYRLTYTLLTFRSQSRTGRVVFSGTTLFNELVAESPKQTKLWQRNRLEAYKGSLRNLLAGLAAGTHEKEGFLVYQTDPARPLLDNPPPMLSSELGRHLKQLDARLLVTPGTLAHERWLVSNSPLEVFYTRFSSRESPYRDAQYAFSQLVLPQQSLGFTVTGQITAPRGFDAVGYLSNDRLATALPDDWQQDTSPQQVSTRTDSTRTQPNQRLATDATLDSLVQRWRRQPVNRTPAVVVHIDKPLYLTGDRLWLSGYVLDAQSHQCDTAWVGPALNVELWSSTNTLMQHQWLAVEAGRAAGSFLLADTLATGTYWLRAYTEADRQQNRPAFERAVLVVNSKSPVSQPTNAAQFAIRTASTSPNEYVEEAPGAPYQTSVRVDSTYLTLTLEARPQRTLFPSVYMLIEARGKLLQSGRIQVRSRSTTERWPTLTWPSGTAKLSLIDSTGRIWARRTVQIPERASPIRASLTYSPPGLSQAQATSLTVTLHDDAGRPITGQVSIAVTDASQVPADSLAPDLARQILALGSQSGVSPIAGTLSPDITLYGRVITSEKPPVNVVVMATTREGVVIRATQTDAAGAFQVDRIALTDTAQTMVQVTSRRGKPIEAKVVFGSLPTTFSPLAEWPFANQLLTKWASLIDAARQRQADNPALYRQGDARQLREVVVRATRPIDDRPDDVKLRSLHNQVDQTVVIDDKTPPYSNLYFLIKAKIPSLQVEEVLDKGRVAYSVKFPGASSIMNAKIPAQSSGFGAPPPPPAPTPGASMQNPLFLIDGFPVNDTDGTGLLAFSPSSIERVEVLKSGAVSAMYGASSSRGVIAFYTKTTRDVARVKGLSRHMVLGYPQARPFARPAANGQASKQDVVAWEPLASTDRLGQLTLSLAVHPSIQTLRVTIQGIANTGQPISCVQTIPVGKR